MTSNMITFFINLFVVFTQLTVLIALHIIFAKNKEYLYEVKIRKSILDLTTKYTRLKITEIAEKIKIYQSTIIKIIKTMLSRNDIYGEYFPSSRSIVFNQETNIAEIDKLMAKYQEWEERSLSKKV